MVYRALAEANSALAILGSSGKFGSTGLGGAIVALSSSSLDPSTSAGIAQCFRYTIMSYGIGDN
jgi:hypothetical protein